MCNQYKSLGRSPTCYHCQDQYICPNPDCDETGGLCPQCHLPTCNSCLTNPCSRSQPFTTLQQAKLTMFLRPWIAPHSATTLIPDSLTAKVSTDQFIPFTESTHARLLTTLKSAVNRIQADLDAIYEANR